MRIAIGSDHAGYRLKEAVKSYLLKQEYTVEDFGTNDTKSCDYNDVATPLALALVKGDFDRGILICGTGIGMSIQANKIQGIRAALVHDVFSAEATRLHNDSNILTMGGRILGDDLAFKIADVWLKTEFSNEKRHQRRVNKIES